MYGTRETQKIEFVPWDARLELPADEQSYLLQDWTQSFCVPNSYRESRNAIEKILGIGQPAPPADEEGEFIVTTADGNRSVAGEDQLLLLERVGKKFFAMNFHKRHLAAADGRQRIFVPIDNTDREPSRTKCKCQRKSDVAGAAKRGNGVGSIFML